MDNIMEENKGQTDSWTERDGHTQVHLLTDFQRKHQHFPATLDNFFFSLMSVQECSLWMFFFSVTRLDVKENYDLGVTESLIAKMPLIWIRI